MIVAIHQPNFIPWFPFFEKMNLCDKFILMVHCQFEKGGWQNRCQVNGKYWTNPVQCGLENINVKYYMNGESLTHVNGHWIEAIAELLHPGLAKKIVYDFPLNSRGTQRIIDICKYYHADEYLTNPDALVKYLDENLITSSGIKIVPFISHNRKHVFEMFNEYGIEGTRNILRHTRKEFLDARKNREAKKDDGHCRTFPGEVIQA